jgi:hypothetical protein
MTRHIASVLTITSALLLSALAIAKDPPAQTLNWPESGTAILRFTFGKFKEIGSLAGTRSYVTDTTAENLWTKPIADATFSLYLYDKNRVRIGEGYITLEQRRLWANHQVPNHNWSFGFSGFGLACRPVFAA